MRLYAKSLIKLELVFFLLLLGGTPSAAEEYIVKLEHDLKDIDLGSLKDPSLPSHVQVLDIVKGQGLIKVDVAEGMAAEDPISWLNQYFAAQYVVRNISLHAFHQPSDPRIPEQWALQTVKAFDAWDISMGSHDVVVAVIDTGIKLTHEDLSDNIWVNPNEVAGNGVDDDGNGYADDINGWDFKDNDKDPTDETSAQNPGHGTHCSGIIGAVCDNDIGICGISPKVSLMAVRFLGSDGSGDLFAGIKAIEYAVNNGAHIISASWGANIPASSAQPLIDAIQSADEKGVIFVAAAGNEGRSNDSSDTYPANAQTPNMVSVAASDRNDEKPQWSNYGRKVDLASPGAEILSTVPGGYKELNGTSMATPLVAGLIALMKAIKIDLSGAQARSILQSTGDEVNISTASNRRINAVEALRALTEERLTVVPAAKTLQPNEEADFSAWGGMPPYSFTSLNPEVATIDETGHLKAVAEGEATIEVTDAEGNKAASVSILVGTPPPPGGAECPLPNPILCMIACLIDPNQPWCNESPNMPDLPELPGLPGLPDLPFPVPTP